MIAVLQRVSRARVSIDGKTVASIDGGLVILLGVFKEDGPEDIRFLVDKISGFRIFNDDQGKMNLALREVKGAVLVVSQFTLCGDWLKGRRPSFIRAAPPEQARELYQQFIACLENTGLSVATGTFGAMMEVELVNDGPVTFVMDSRLKTKKT